MNAVVEAFEARIGPWQNESASQFIWFLWNQGSYAKLHHTRSQVISDALWFNSNFAKLGYAFIGVIENNNTMEGEGGFI